MHARHRRTPGGPAGTHGRRAAGSALLDGSGEMAVNSAGRAVLRLWLLCGAACAAAAAGDDGAVPFDIEGSSAVGRLDPPEASEPRVAPGRLPPAAEVQCPCPSHPGPGHLWVPRSCPSLPLLPSPICPESFTCPRSVHKLEESYFVSWIQGVASWELRLWNRALFKPAKGQVSCALGAGRLGLSPGAAVALLSATCVSQERHLKCVCPVPGFLLLCDVGENTTGPIFLSQIKQ